jgi:hypothetical protein
MNLLKDHDYLPNMYRKWKDNGEGDLRSLGRLGAMSVKEVELDTNNMLNVEGCVT